MKSLGLVLGILLLGGACGPKPGEPSRTVVVAEGALRATVPFQGTLEARRVEMISVGLQGAAILSDIVAEGTPVQPGDVLARFDSAQIGQDLARQESELVRARQELESLEKAELPLELLDMQSKLAEALAEIEAEERFLESARDLSARGLMSEGEVAQQQRKVDALRARREQMNTRLELTREHVHAARLAKARAALAAAERQRDFFASQLALCEVRAPVAGVAMLMPLPISGDYRPAHVGATLFRNQVFMCIPDPTEHVVRGFISESDLPWVRPGNVVEAVPSAFPRVRLTGRVETVGGMAQTRFGFPIWRKFFPVLIALDALDEPMPVGISVRADIVAGELDRVPLLPREAVEWRGNRAWVRRVAAAGLIEDVEIETGLADATHIEVRSGVQPGDRVLLP